MDSVCSKIEACPIINNDKPYVPESFTINESSDPTYSIVGGVAGAVVIGGALAGGLLVRQKRRNMDIFDADSWAKAAQVNPLYFDRTIKYDNPLYQQSTKVASDDDGY